MSQDEPSQIHSVSDHVWRVKYRHPGEMTPSDSFQRVARAIAQAEPARRDAWTARFASLMLKGRFLPGGRILAGAGGPAMASLVNCFVGEPVGPAQHPLPQQMLDIAATLRAGGGVGLDFSGLSPASASGGVVGSLHAIADMTAQLAARGRRRGALMACLRDDHPDILAFIRAKQESSALSAFCLSVLVSDKLIEAVRADAPWPLRRRCGSTSAVIPARALWASLAGAATQCGDPGVLFIDRIRRLDPLAYCERIIAANPCGEAPLPAHGVCVLGSLNLTAFVRRPFSPEARFDGKGLRQATRLAVRFLDNVLDVTDYPLALQRKEALAARRIGLGVMGLGDALVMLGARYDAPEGRRLAARLMGLLRDSAYLASSALAAEKGAFPLFQAKAHLAGPFLAGLPSSARQAIDRRGLRNGALLAIAPTGSISLLAHAVSSGHEPIQAAWLERRVQGRRAPFLIEAFALRAHRARGGVGRPAAFVEAGAVPATSFIAMTGALQAFVDNAIAATVLAPPAAGAHEVEQLLLDAFDAGLKGLSVYRRGARADIIRPVSG